MDKISVNPDGTLLVFGTGIHLKVKGQVYAIGLWRLTFDPETGEILNQEYHGMFDVLQPEIIDAICSLLGPAGQPTWWHRREVTLSARTSCRTGEDLITAGAQAVCGWS